MQTTGSRTRSGARPRAAQVLLVGLVAAIAFGVFAMHAGSARAVTPVTVVVNSTANTDDGLCSGAPNAGTGNCTLHEAIDAVNAGLASVIKFHPAVFSVDTPGVINLESGLGQLPAITQTGVTIDGTGAGVIIDGDGNANGVYCEAAGLFGTDLTDPTYTAPIACTSGLEVHANQNAFSFTLQGGGDSHFVIQHVTGNGLFLCGGVPTGSCLTFSFGTVLIDGVDIRNANADAVHAVATNLTDVSVTNSKLSAAVQAFYSLADSTGTVTRLLGHNSVTLDSNAINSQGNDSVDMNFLGNKNSHSSINAVVTHNTFKASNTAVDIFAQANTSDHGTYNVDINHNSDIHATNGPGVRVDLEAFIADYTTSTINLSDNGNISGGFVAVAGASAAGISCKGDCPPAIDVFANIGGGDSHSSSAITMDRNGDITGTGDGISIANKVCCGSGNSGSTDISDNGNIVGQTSEGIYLQNYAYDDGTTGVADHGSSQVTIHHNHLIDGESGDGVYVQAGAGTGACVGASGGAGAASENTSAITVSDNGPITGRSGDGLNLNNFACASGGIGDDNTATVHATGNGRIQGSTDGVFADNESGNLNATSEALRNTSTTDISHNADIVGNSIGVDVDFTFAGTTGGIHSGDNNTASTMVQDNGAVSGTTSDGIFVDSQSGSEGGPGDGNTAGNEISGNGAITGGGGRGVDALVYSGGAGYVSDNNTSTNKTHDNANITGIDDDAVYYETQAGDNNLTADGDHNNITSEVIHNGQIQSLSDNGIEVEMSAGGGVVDSVDNHTTTRIKQNGAIMSGPTDDNGINLAALNDPGTGAGGWVCCDAANTNTVDISDNVGGISGFEHGIGFGGICCSVNLVTIQNNTGGAITGHAGDGIHYVVDGCEDVTDPALYFTAGTFVDVNGDGFPDAIAHSVNALTISGNDISHSALNGIFAACGAFDGHLANPGGPADALKSAITGNTINGNGENGIYLDTVQGVNIGPNNTISGNGFASNNNVHAGIQITNVVADCWAQVVGNACTPFLVRAAAAAVYLPSNGNTITKNTIFDNHNAFTDALGIDLNPGNPPGTPPGLGNDGHRLGCLTKGNPIDPNDCIAAPSITLIAAGGKIGGTTCSLCTVEVFLADAAPADQPNTVATTQHGEGRTYLASGTADASGNFSVQLPCGQAAGDLTATATSKVKDTSEFSENRPFLGTPVCATATPTASNTPTPTNTPMPVTPSPTPAKACGDVNDDRHVNSVDAQLILQFSAGLISSLPNMPSADVNHSGSVNPVDSALILQVEAGLLPASSLHCV